MKLDGALSIFDRGDLTEEEQKLRDKVVKAIEDFKKSQASTDKRFQREAKERLGNAYWEFVIYLVIYRMEQKQPTLKFTEDEELLINFGLLDKSLVPSSAKILQVIKEENKYVPLIGPFRMYRLTDWLVERYHDLYKMPGGPLRGKFLFQTEAAKLKVALEKQEKEVNNFLKEVETEASLLKGFRNFLIEYRKFIKWELKILLKPKLTVADENALKKRAEEKKKLEATFNDFLSKLKDYDEDKYDDFMRLHRRWKAMLSDYIEINIEVEIYERREELTIRGLGRKERNPLPPKSQIEDELRELRSAINGAAKKARVDTCPVIISEKQIITKKEAVDLFNRVRMVDVDAFRTSLAKRLGKPGILFVPGNGNGMFHYENNVFIIPITPPKTATYSILASVVQYRWENDEDRTLRDSYQQLKPYRNLNILELRNALLNDYVLWVTREALGYKVLDKQVRPWFEYYIKVNKEAVEELKEALSPLKKKKLSKDEKEALRQKQLQEEEKRRQQLLKIQMQRQALVNKSKKILAEVLLKKLPDRPNIDKQVKISGNGDKTVTIVLDHIHYLDLGDVLDVLRKLYAKGYLDDIFRYDGLNNGGAGNGKDKQTN